MSISQKAAWIIERNIDRPLTLASLADACKVSRSHLSHAFVAATGTPVVAYLRGRRLSHAAETLAKGAPDILQVALAAGYNSHEAFTRAFRDQFGATPESVRERRTTDGLALTRPYQHPFETRRLPPPRIMDEPKILVAGLRGHFPQGPSTNGIPALWQRFSPLMEQIPNIRPGMPVGVTMDTDEECGFDYLAALEVTRFGDVPKGVEKLEIPARAYAVFDHLLHIAKLPETYRAIWDEALTDLGCKVAHTAPMLERHKPAFDPRTGEGGVEVWIPLER
jgi:AraC family transcriptional regulator